MKSATLNFSWAEKHWKDPISGTDVVCLSPPQKKHFRLPYFRLNMMTADGRYAVFIASTELKGALVAGDVRFVARDLLNGEIRDLGPVPLKPDGTFEPTGYAVARYSHKMNFTDYSNPDALAIIQIDLDTGARRRIELSEKLTAIYDSDFDATGRYIYAPWWKEKGDRWKTMQEMDYRAMMAAQPGCQEMVRIDLETGKVESVFNSSVWWMGHPNPHPSLPNIFMCCQEWCGENGSSQWGACPEHQRIRVIDLSTGKWMHELYPDLPWEAAGMGFHEHWAPNSMTVYSHTDWPVNAICKIDLKRGVYQPYPCLPNKGSTAHLMIAPNEKFVIGDGQQLDKNMPDDLRRRIEALPSDSIGALFAKGYLDSPDGGETVWIYSLPENPLSLSNYDNNKRQELFDELVRHPERAVKATPLCRFRSLFRTKMFGYRLETNAHVTPDSRWAVLLSSSDDDWFEVWAARVPEEALRS